MLGFRRLIDPGWIPDAQKHRVPASKGDFGRIIYPVLVAPQFLIPGACPLCNYKDAYDDPEYGGQARYQAQREF